MRKLSFCKLLPLGALLLDGCGLFSASPPVRLDTVAFKVDATANDDTPVAVDLVMVGKKDIVDTIGQLSAADWFARKNQLSRDYPDQIAVMDWELVPGQGVPATKVKPDRKAWAAYFFANYAAPGAHRAAVTNLHDVDVTLGQDDLIVASQK
jgi:type VI secretion system protein